MSQGTREQTHVLGTAELGCSLISRRRGQSTGLFLIIEEACVVFSFLISYVFLIFIQYHAFGPGQADGSASGSSCAVSAALGQRGNRLLESRCSNPSALSVLHEPGWGFSSIPAQEGLCPSGWFVSPHWGSLISKKLFYGRKSSIWLCSLAGKGDYILQKQRRPLEILQKMQEIPSNGLSSWAGGYATAGLQAKLLPSIEMQDLTSSPLLAGGKVHFVCICVVCL